MNIDPMQSLAISMHAKKGVYALLVGSGISRSAKIPTGWEITLGLVRKIAEISGEVCGQDPEVWYRSKYGKSPDYGEILDAVAKTQAERQQLLRAYWEPTDQEREEGEKLPTEAHRAIARLMQNGVVRLVITTNFDRLLETALADIGIVPTVMSSVDQVLGAMPLIHTQACIFKVHGDYLDTRIKNTTSELASYPGEFESLLGRIFDEFGLIVCGWSADWDVALRDAVFRAPGRRFSTYWALRGKPGQCASDLIRHRDAQIIKIKDADDFFVKLDENISSLSEINKPHPMSRSVAVATAKKYMSEERFNIRFDDLISDEVNRLVAVAGEGVLSVQDEVLQETVTKRLKLYDVACDSLVGIAASVGVWGGPQHLNSIRRALNLLVPRGRSGLDLWVGLQRYPAMLILYAFGIGAIEAGAYEKLNEIFRLHYDSSPATGRRRLVVKVLTPAFIIDRDFDWRENQVLAGMEGNQFPLNQWVHDGLRDVFKSLIPDNYLYTMMFYKFEMILALCSANYDLRSRSMHDYPSGLYMVRHDIREINIEEIMNSLKDRRDESPYVTSRLFGDNVASAAKLLQDLRDNVRLPGKI